MLYLLLYKVFAAKVETYYWSYLLVGLCLVPITFALFLFRRISTKAIHIPILVVGVTESLTVLLQFLQLLPSNSSLFSTTGTGTNPNIAAMIIVMCLPSAIELVKEVKKPYRNLMLLLPLLLVTAIMMTKCRSALVGLFAILGIYLVCYWKGLKKTSQRVAAIGLIGLTLGVFLLVHSQKTASHQGRQTIWKITASIIEEKPLLGYGYGFFEKNYNLHQADYFNSGTRDEAERMGATFTNMAYNEYLEQAVMGGITGAALFCALLASMLLTALKQAGRQQAPLAGVACFALMSLFNFTASHPLLFTLLMLYGSMAMMLALEKKSEQTKQTNRTMLSKQARIVSLATALCVAALLLMSFPKYAAQKQLTKAERMLQERRVYHAELLLKEIAPHIETSEAFHTIKTELLFALNDFDGARMQMKEMLELTSNPMLMEQVAYLSERQGLPGEAEAYLILAKGIEPHRFAPRMQLMQLYRQQNQTSKAMAMAKEILAMEIKIPSPQITYYKQQASLLLRQMESHALGTHKLGTN